MKTNFSRRVLVALLLALTSSAALADLMTGASPLSSIAGGPFDSVNLANLNVSFSIPVFNRAGKGLPFFYNLTYNSLIWSPTAPNGASKWTPVPNWGWTVSSDGVTGYVTYGDDSDSDCYYSVGRVQYLGGLTTIYSDFGYHDQANAIHLFTGLVTVYIKLDDNPNNHCHASETFPLNNALATDNSGYVLTTDAMTATVKARGGLTIQVPRVGSPTGAGSVTDANGNAISINSAGTITDTLGTTALTINGSPPSYPNCSNSVTYKYSAPGAQATVTVSYRAYTVQTDFGVGIPEFPATNECLVDKVTLPDTSFYQFTYETAYGLGSNVTGRIVQITLPTGGTIAYSYNGYICHYRCNAMMTDGSPSFMYRTLSGGLWSYYRGYQNGSNHPLQTTTEVVDPVSNETDLKFSSIYETERKVYQGSSSQNQVLDYSYMCYNGNMSDSTCPAAVVTPPIASRGHNDHANQITFGVPYSSVWDYYDTYGNLTKETDYTFASPPTLIRTVTNHYNGCTPNNICNELANSQTTDGGGASKSYTTYAYDQGGITHGKVTTISRSTTGSTGGPFLSQGYTYDSHGVVQTAIDPNGTVTNYSTGGYSCNSTFPNSISVPSQFVGTLTTTYSYNCTGAVVTAATDPNHNTVTTSYSYPHSDPYYWRPASTTDQMGNLTYHNYYGVNNYSSHVTVPGQVESVMNWNGGNSTSDNLTTLDSYGRVWLLQTRQSPTSANWDTSQYFYDESGRVLFTARPRSAVAGPNGASQGGIPATGYSYDNLGRYTQIYVCNGTDCNGRNTSYSYNLNDVKISTGPGQSFSKQLEYDILGRVTSVCEMSTSLSGVGACGQNTPQTGYKTTYTYDALSNLTGVTQGSQTRSFTYDGLSRMLSEANPENGTTHYTYDSDSTCGGYTGNKVKRVDAANNVTCYSWDGLHRLTGINYVSGPNAANSMSKYYNYDSVPGYDGVSLSNPLGRMTLSITCCLSGGAWGDWEMYGYDARGETTDDYFYDHDSYTHYHTVNSYFPNGAVAQRNGYYGDTGTSKFSNPLVYSEDGKGRPNGLTDTQTGDRIWNSAYTTYNSSDQPLSLVFYPSADDEVFTYGDLYLGHMTNWESDLNTIARSQYGALTWNPNGTLQKMAINDTANPANSQTCNYGYDDLVRLTSDNCGSVWNQTFSYDQYGNISKSNYHLNYGSGNRISGYSYDGMGNVTNDGVHSYTYDAEGQPVKVDGTTIRYDALNRALERDLSNGPVIDTIYAPDGYKFAFMNGTTPIYSAPLVAGVQAVYTAQSPARISHWRHADWLGTSRLMDSTAGTVYYDGAYAPFGENYAEIGTTDRSFTGQTQDTTSGLYDFPNRQDSSAQGRWLAPDPAGVAAVDITNPQTWNRYAYVGNNPVSNVDPLGLYLCDSDDDGGDDLCDGDDDGGGGGGGGDDGGDNSCDYDACVVAPPPPDVPPEEIPLPDSIPDDSGDGLLPGSVSIDDPWPQDQPATAPTCFFYYGNYGGPCYTGGQWTPLEDMTPEQQANLPPPVDEEDACYQSHDYCYSNSRIATGTTYGSSPSQAQTNAENFLTGQCDLVLSACLSMYLTSPQQEWQRKNGFYYKAHIKFSVILPLIRSLE